MWDIKPSAFTKMIEKDACKKVLDISIDMGSGLCNLAPVDTSRFVSNMNVSFNAPDSSFDEDKMLGSGGALAATLQSVSKLSKTKLQDVYFTNVTPYGGELEKGRSVQAPDGVFLVTFLGVAAAHK